MKKIIYILTSILLTQLIISQEAFDKSRYYSFGDIFYNEAHVLPGNDADSIEVLLLYSIVNDKISFKQVNPMSNPGSYQALPSVEYAFKDSDGIIQKRIISRDTVFLDSYNKTISKKDYINGFIKIKLKKDKYKVEVKLSDDNIYNIHEEEFELDAKISDKESDVLIYDPIFVTNLSSQPFYKTNPIIKGGNIPFKTSNVRAIIPIQSKTDDELLVSYRIQKVKYDPKKVKESKSQPKTIDVWQEEIDLTGNLSISTMRAISIEKGRKNNEFILEIQRSNENSNHSILDIELPVNALVPGNYELGLSIEDEISETFDFEVIWFDKPLSLKDPEYAAKSMYYILTEEEYDKIRSGDEEDIIRKVFDYWKQQDPSPATPYNEAMAAYFERVDYSFFNYQTIKERDGAATARGKIHILYGPPDRVDQDLKNDNAREIWTYEKVKKQFVFEMVAIGIYKLTEIKEL